MIKCETFYTGGGIWLTVSDITDKSYWAVTSDFPSCISLYDDKAGDEYPFRSMVLSLALDEMGKSVFPVYQTMLNDLMNKRRQN